MTDVLVADARRDDELSDEPTAAELDARIERTFAPVLAEIAAGAVERERRRILPLDEVRALRDAGFGALRVPRRFGGWGASLQQLFRLLIALGEADANLPQLLRGHIAFVETQLALPPSALRTEWLSRIADGEVLFGNAQAERGESSTPTTEIVEVEGRLLLRGRKFYSTGTLYADWIWTGGRHGDHHVAVAVPADAPGVTRVDDWAGFGQRLTGSGTTVFDDVEVDPRQVLAWTDNDEHRSLAYVTGLYQLILLAALAGTARAIVRDAVAFVRPRTRTFGVPGLSSPRHDPLVQQVVGRLGAQAFAAEAAVLEAVRRLEAADLGRRHDASDEPRYYDALARVFEAQQVVIDLVLDAAGRLFEVGGASAVDADRALDRHWRNARTLASHNPAILRAQLLGDYRLNGVLPKSPLHRVRDEAAER
ncbi:acyl-CoA dehydrogenase family protein [Microcella alkalica]|uniref:acyl-CoA dehydrogenase family protein n=1 Tax=Microcella alkalica TaxID=355930 RepID=UPI00145CA114|nr:acyl-CoA dehydrogenase family protein [Microcella alkalica]